MAQTLKKKAPQDATLRNVRAAHKRIASMERRLAAFERAIRIAFRRMYR